MFTDLAQAAVRLSISAAAILAAMLAGGAESKPPEPESNVEYLRHRASLETEEARSRYDAEYKKRLHDYYADAAAGGDQAAQKSPTSWRSNLLPMPAGGWSLLEVDEGNTTVTYISRRSIVRSGGYIYVWIRYEFRDPQEWKGGGPKYLSLVERLRMECNLRKSAVMAQTAYAGNNLTYLNQEESSTQDEGRARAEPVIPGTVGEKYLDAVCAAKQS